MENCESKLSRTKARECSLNFVNSEHGFLFVLGKIKIGEHFQFCIESLCEAVAGTNCSVYPGEAVTVDVLFKLCWMGLVTGSNGGRRWWRRRESETLLVDGEYCAGIA